ncbi:MAG: glycoside hydrolase family 3 N-terminal domain-containing protein [Bacteroidales bacterium]|jgi:beta-glucosidase-like glycosyl hydrolase/CubicO group peptidase (beta-lactamase class C family)|nr:glycoside hydrolase family 3 N-terminal domain-containing protein [Bacteroidales bacterium]
MNKLYTPLFITFFVFSFTISSLLAQEERPEFIQDQENLWVDSVMNKLSLDEKIGQLFMVAAYSNKYDNHEEEITTLIKKYKIGGLIFFQGGPLRQARLTNKYQSVAELPLLIAIDGEWGLGMRLDSTISYPRQMMLGAITDDSLIYRMGYDLGEQMKRLGIHINFAPVVDINNNPQNPVINVRSFGEDRVNVSKKSIAYMNGMQDAGIIAVAKHFPGHGDTHLDSHYALPVIGNTRERLDTLELFPFQRIIDAGVKGVMVAHLSVPALEPDIHLPTTLSEPVVTQLLKNKMGFDGLIFTDALNMKGVTQNFKPGDIEGMAVHAGNDVLLFPEDVPKAVHKIKKQVKAGNIPPQRIDESCRKILRAKFQAGLHHHQRKNDYVPLENLEDDLNQIMYEVTRRELIQSGLTLIQNQEDMLPVKNLSNKKFASLAFNAGETTVFQQTLSLYAQVDHYQFDPSQSDLILEMLKDYDMVFTSIHNTSFWPANNYRVNPLHLEFMDTLAQETRVVFSLFGNPYSLRKFNNIKNLDAVLIGYDDESAIQQYAAQAIFGGIEVHGRLPVSIHSHYQAGLGIPLKKKIRLSYGIPEQVGMSSGVLTRIDSIAQQAIETMATPGCRILAARNGMVFYDKSFGYHTYLKKQKVSPDDIYDIASITKIVATMPSLMKLYEQGLFSLEAQLADFIPELDTTNKGKLKVKDILTHQAQLNGWIPYYYYTLQTLFPNKDLLNSDFSEEYPYKLGNHSYVAKNFMFREGIYSHQKKPGFTTRVAEDLYILDTYKDSIFNRIRASHLRENDQYHYSDLGFYYFYKIIEDYTGKNFREYVDSCFYEPLGASRTGFQPLKRFSRKEIVPTENDLIFRKQLLHGDVHDPGAAMLGGVCGHAGVFSTANDLAKIMQMFLNDGNYGGEEFLKPETIELFTTSPFLDQDNRRALGFDKPQMDYSKEGPTCKCVSAKSFGHSGFTGTLAWADPEEKIVYIFLSNRIHPDQDNGKLIRTNVRTDIQQVIYDAIIESRVKQDIIQ